MLLQIIKPNGAYSLVNQNLWFCMGEAIIWLNLNALILSLQPKTLQHHRARSFSFDSVWNVRQWEHILMAFTTSLVCSKSSYTMDIVYACQHNN